MCLPARTSISGRPDNIREQFGDVDGALANGAIASPIGTTRSSPIRFRPTAPAGIGDRMTVLEPQHDLLARGWRRQAGVAVSRPGIGVMGRRKRAVTATEGPGAALAEDVESIFDDVVPGGADDMQEQLAAESGRRKRARSSLLSSTMLPAVGPQLSHHSARISPSSPNRVSQQVTAPPP